MAMSPGPLRRALTASKDVERGLTRLEKSLFELRDDVDAALRAFVAKNQPRARLAVAGHEQEMPAAVESAAVEEFDPSSTHVYLSPFGDARTMGRTTGSSRSAAQPEGPADARVVAVTDCEDEQWRWENHPHGDEVLVLLSGRVTLIVEGDGADASLALQPGRACVVPRGTWHRTRPEAPSRLLAITCWRGTEHRSMSRPPAGPPTAE